MGRMKDRFISEYQTMTDEDQWGGHPYLPVKRSNPDGGWLQAGVLVADRGPVVFLGNIWDVGLARILRIQLWDTPVLRYATFEAVIADGWVVD